MSSVEESLEWRSIMDALHAISVEKARSTLQPREGIVAYTDGACIKNPGGPAGWSAILLAAEDVINNQAAGGTKRIECYGHIPEAETTTNNRAEITAVLCVLCLARPDIPLTIYSDSEYTIKVAQGTYQMKANPDLWSMYRLLRNHRKSPPIFEWVRGHAGYNLNERADELAGLGAWNGNVEAYHKWQESTLPEAHNRLPDSEMAALRQNAQKLKALFESIDPVSGRVGANEREFVDKMAKQLQKNKFVPTEKQRNWLKGLVAKYKV